MRSSDGGLTPAGAEDLAPLHQKLGQAGIVTSLRADRSGKRYIRLSPHFYNTEREFEKLMEYL